MEAAVVPDRPKSLVVAGFGVGQIVAFASSFYLMGVLGDAVAADLGLSSTFVFATVSLSLAVPALLVLVPILVFCLETTLALLPRRRWSGRSPRE